MKVFLKVNKNENGLEESKITECKRNSFTIENLTTEGNISEKELTVVNFLEKEGIFWENPSEKKFKYYEKTKSDVFNKNNISKKETSVILRKRGLKTLSLKFELNEFNIEFEQIKNRNKSDNLF